MLDSVGREAVMDSVMDWWTEAEKRFTTGKEAGPLASYLMFSMALACDAESVAKVPVGAYIVGLRAGYSLRACIDTVVSFGPPYVVWPAPLDVSMFDTDLIRTVAGGPVDANGILSANEEDVEALQPVFEHVTAIADSRFEEVASVDVPFWEAVVSIATYQLQKYVQKAGLVRSGRKFNEITIESVLRFGFVVRCLDEALGIEPVLRDSPHSPAAFPTLSSEEVSSLGDEELGGRLYEEASVAHRVVIGDEAEREVGGGPIFVLGVERWEALSEDGRDFAIISSRSGLMIRLAELHLLPGASDHDSRVVVSILEAVQDWMQRFNVDADGLSELEQRSRIESAVIATAQSVTSTAEATEGILAVTPGTSASVRRNAFGQWLSLAEEKGVLAAGLSREDHERLMVFGYVLAVVRELMISVQAPEGQ